MNFEEAKEQVKKHMESKLPINEFDLWLIQRKIEALNNIKSEDDLASFEYIKFSTITVSLNEYTIVSAMIRKLMKI